MEKPTSAAERIVLSETSGSAVRSSAHSASPTTLQPRALTNSARRDFLVTRGTLIARDIRVMFGQRIGEIVSAGAISLRDEVQEAGGGRVRGGFDRPRTR